MAIAERVPTARRSVAPAAPIRTDDLAPDVPIRQRPLPRRSTNVGTRAHASTFGEPGGTARAERIARLSPPRLAVRPASAEAAPDPVRPPQLALVPRRRRAARVLGILLGLTVLTMLAAAAFQTQLAQRQVELDRLDGDISAAREQYDELRRERAELRSPERLAGIAEQMGMVPATDTGFMVMSPDVLAEVQIAAGHIGSTTADGEEGPLDQFRSVKSVMDGTP